MLVRFGFAPGTPAAPPRAGHRRRWKTFVEVAAMALLLASAANTWGATGEVLRLRCINGASGTSWAIVVDLGRSQVDSLPATITEKSISWHDPKGGFFDLERATGKLQFRNASSTGGYFMHYICRPD
jgi:hypothetical protein